MAREDNLDESGADKEWWPDSDTLRDRPVRRLTGELENKDKNSNNRVTNNKYIYNIYLSPRNLYQ